MTAPTIPFRRAPDASGLSRRAALAGLTAWLAAACSPKAAGAGPLTVGMELDYPPFEMRNPQGEPSGISVELARALAADLQRPLQVENLPFAGLIPAVKSGRIELAISSITITEERRQNVGFSEPYWRSGLAILSYDGAGVQGAADLVKPGIQTVVKLGTTGHLYAQKNLQNFRVVDRLSAASLEIEQHKAQAFLYDQLSVVRIAQKNPGLRPLLEPIQVEHWGIVAAKGNQGLLDQVNRYLQAARTRGDFDAWVDKYLPEERAAARKWGGEIIY